MLETLRTVGGLSLGRVAKGVKCSVVGCGKQAVRSLPAEKAGAAGLDVGGARRAYLCRDHYKEFRRSPTIKQGKRIEKWRHRT